MSIGARTVGNLPLALNSPNSHAEIGDTRTRRSAANDLFMAATASGRIG